MFRPRIIPVLLLKNKGLVKTVKFKEPKYVGDPINAVRLFNDFNADELVFLDITANKENRIVSLEVIKNIADEAYMPFAVGGGIKKIEDIKQLITAGAEKVVINTASAITPELISEASNLYGNQSIIISIDVKKNIFGKYKVFILSGKKQVNVDLVEYIQTLENLGAGELLINSIDKDGTMSGYDIALIKLVADSVKVPVIACGGAGKPDDFYKAVNEGGASAVAAGSMFVFHGPRRAVLINYPTKKEILEIFKSKND